MDRLPNKRRRAAQEIPDGRFNRLSGWMDLIESDVWILMARQAMFKEVRQIIEAHPQINRPNPFLEWMLSVYTVAMTAGVRRHVMKDKFGRSVPFARVLEELIQAPEVFSRQRFLELVDGQMYEDLANEEFDVLAGKGGDFISKVLVGADLKDLNVKAKAIADFVSHRNAHLDANTPYAEHPEQIPTRGDVEECLALLDRLVSKYLILFRGYRPGGLTPAFLGPWRDIFTVPWILPGSSVVGEERPTERKPRGSD